MKYTMKSGILYLGQSHQALAKIKSLLSGPVKKIFRNDDEMVLKTDIRYPDELKRYSGDVRYREYILMDCRSEIIAMAHPDYAEGEDPAVAGWPVYRMSRVDHAQISIEGVDYLLTMHNSQNYALEDSRGCETIRIMHRGISGGWSIEEDCGFVPEIICGIFVFCRYIEQENELLLV